MYIRGALADICVCICSSERPPNMAVYGVSMTFVD